MILVNKQIRCRKRNHKKEIWIMRYLKNFSLKLFENIVSFTVNEGDFFELKISGYNGVPENIMCVLGEVIKIKDGYPHNLMITFEIMFYRDQNELEYKEIDNYWFDKLQTSKYYKIQMEEFVSIAKPATKDQTELLQRYKDAQKFGL